MQYKILKQVIPGQPDHYIIWDNENKEAVDGAPTLLDARNLLRMYQ
jgi:hypothetical protein